MSRARPLRRRWHATRGADAAHPYLGDGAFDRHGHDRCAHCKLPRQPGDCHDLPPQSADADLIDARRLGERLEDHDAT